MEDAQKKRLIENMVTNLPVLRKALGVTQEGLATLIGVNRSTVAAIENHKRNLNWETFLALLLVFIKNPASDKLLNAMEIYTDDFNTFIKGEKKGR